MNGHLLGSKHQIEHELSRSIQEIREDWAEKGKTIINNYYGIQGSEATKYNKAWDELKQMGIFSTSESLVGDSVALQLHPLS